MSDDAIAGGFDAPAATPSVVLSEAPATPPNPIQGTVPPREAEKPAAKPEPAKNAKEAVQRAQEAVKAKEAANDKSQKDWDAHKKELAAKDASKPEPKQEARQEQPRDNGRFAPRQEQQATQPDQSQTPAHHREPPSRFSQDAKAEWEAVPDKVKAEVHRATRELEQGINKYRGDAERYETVRQFDEMARKNGGDLSKSLAKVVDIEDTFSRDPIEGFRKIAYHFGIPLEQVAAHILNQPYDQRQGASSEVIGLKNEIAQLKESLSSLQPVVQEYKQTSDERALAEWAADKPHFAQLRGDVAALVQQGYSPDDAYRQAVYDFQEKASAFGFVPQPAASSAPAQSRPLNPAGQKSITGAPAAGSDPVSRKAPATSVKEAVKRAFAAHA